MTANTSLNYLAGYPPDRVAEVRSLIEQDRLDAVLLSRYPHAHAVRTDRALYNYIDAIKRDYLRNAGALSRVAFDNTLHIVEQALGTHTRIARVQGAKLRAKREIRVASLFKTMPPEFLRMIAVHELAHLKCVDHDKAFYQLCRSMETDYHQLEFHLRAYLAHLAAHKAPLWAAAPAT